MARLSRGFSQSAPARDCQAVFRLIAITLSQDGIALFSKAKRSGYFVGGLARKHLHPCRSDGAVARATHQSTYGVARTIIPRDDGSRRGHVRGNRAALRF